MADGLIRTTVFLTVAQHDRLRRLAFEQRSSIAELIRDAIDEKYGPSETGKAKAA